MRLFLLLLCLASPAGAQVPDRDTLEAPDRIWLRDTLHPAAKLGITVPFLPHVQFENGAFQDRMTAFSYVITPPTCADPFNCADATNSATLYEGAYTLTQTGMSLSDVTRSPLIFDRAENVLAIQSDSFARGEETVPLQLIDGALVRATPGGSVRYVPARPSDINRILGLAIAFEVSIARNYDCLVAGHLMRKTSANADELATALLALAQLGAEEIANRNREHELLKGRDIFDLPQKEQAEAEQLTFESVALRLATFEMREAYFAARSTDAKAALPDVPVIADAVPAAILDRIPQDALPQMMQTLERRIGLVRVGLPALYHYENVTPNRSEPSDLLCHAGQ